VSDETQARRRREWLCSARRARRLAGACHTAALCATPGSRPAATHPAGPS